MDTYYNKRHIEEASGVCSHALCERLGIYGKRRVKVRKTKVKFDEMPYITQYAREHRIPLKYRNSFYRQVIKRNNLEFLSLLGHTVDFAELPPELADCRTDKDFLPRPQPQPVTSLVYTLYHSLSERAEKRRESTYPGF